MYALKCGNKQPSQQMAKPRGASFYDIAREEHRIQVEKPPMQGKICTMQVKAEVDVFEGYYHN
jgi:hypothetical protein